MSLPNRHWSTYAGDHVDFSAVMIVNIRQLVVCRCTVNFRYRNYGYSTAMQRLFNVLTEYSYVCTVCNGLLHVEYSIVAQRGGCWGE